MRVDLLPVMLMSFGLSSSTLPAAKNSPHARYWLAADDPFLRPGEGTYVWMWIEYPPGPGAPVLFEQYPAKVLWHAFSDASIMCDRPWPDTYSAGIVGVTSYYQGQLLEYQGKLFKDGIIGIHFINALPNSGKPGYAKSPLAIYQFYFKPKSYESDVYTLTLDLSKYTVMALEVPALNKFFPDVQWVFWPHSGEPPAPPLIIRTGPECFSDCDTDGLLDISDFICFQTLFAIGDPKADCDSDGQLLIDDFICFQTLFAIGC